MFDLNRFSFRNISLRIGHFLDSSGKSGLLQIEFATDENNQFELGVAQAYRKAITQVLDEAGIGFYLHTGETEVTCTGYPTKSGQHAFVAQDRSATHEQLRNLFDIIHDRAQKVFKADRKHGWHEYWSKQLNDLQLDQLMNTPTI